jgi:hypothetical protein
VIVSAEVVALIAAAVAVFAAVLSVRATALAARTVLAIQTGPESNQPVLRVVAGRARRDLATDARDYTFSVTATNGTAEPWTCQSPALRVTYRTRANFLGAVDLVSEEPLTVAAGQTRTAELQFTTRNVIPRHCRIDAYTLVLAGTSSGRLLLDASLPDVLEADSDGAGSHTWGWD